MRELAREARVSLVTPYTLFGSKANVLYALLESVIDALDTAGERLDAEDPIDGLYPLTQFSVHEYARDSVCYRSLLTAMVTTGELLPVPRFVHRCTTLWQRGLEAGSARGLFRPHTRPDLVALQIQMNDRGAMERWIEGGVALKGVGTQLLYGWSLCPLAVASGKGRARTRDRERQLESLPQTWAGQISEQTKEDAL